MKTYIDFLKTKQIQHKPHGFTLQDQIHPKLFPFQKDIVKWALQLGRAATFADCGLGKTFMQLEWARHVYQYTGKPVLVVAPLAVSGQTIEEGKRIGLDIVYARGMGDLVGGETIVITNYEMLAKFRMGYFGGLVVDESSILKNFTGKTKRLLIRMAQEVEYRLACTATPAPNDHLELGNHAEFLGVMQSREMIQRWFVNDSMKAGGYSLKAHGADDFWAWVASWAVALSKPSDVGDYSDDGYILPPLNFIGHVVPVDHKRAWKEVGKNGQASLLLVGNTSATGMHKEKRATLDKRMKETADVFYKIKEQKPDEGIVIWCEYNYEADILVKLIPEAIEVRGNEKLAVKQQKLLDFSNGKFKYLITKPKIAAFGLNWQHIGEHIGSSINHQFESLYQRYKRSHRFGRTEPVNYHFVYAESEGGILANTERKHQEHELMQHEMIRAMKANGMSLDGGHRLRLMGDYAEYTEGHDWKLYHGDSTITLQNEPDNETDLIVQSPPFKGLYIYSSNVEDLGNCVDDRQFYDQYQFILRDELRRLKPGAIKCEHCKDLPLYANRDGAMGLQDFPGELIQAHLEAGFWLVGWKTIWKDPVIEMQRTKNAGLLWSSAFCQRAERARQGMADYVLVFQKPTESGNAPDTYVSHNPIPQSVVDRCIDLWSMAGENVQSPYHKPDMNELLDLIIVDKSPEIIIGQIDSIMHWLRDGRNLVVRVCDPLEMGYLISDMQPYGMVFHSRVALTDGTWLVVFRKWVDEMKEDKNENIKHVTHDLVAPTGEIAKRMKVSNQFHDIGALTGSLFDNNPLPDEAWEEYQVTENKGVILEGEHVFIGTDPPKFWDSDRDYSIQVWQRYASPVWFDLVGLPSAHPDIWMDIQQTNVLNYRQAREKDDEKHICPLQIDVIEKCIEDHTIEGQRVSSSFVGIGSEIATAIRMGRTAYGSELKRSYYELAVKNIQQVEAKAATPSLFDFINA